jgi:hypothetical protein
MQVMKNIFALSLFLCFCAFSQGVDEVDSLAPWIPRNLPDGIQFSGAVGSRFRISALVKDAIISPGSAFDFEVDIHATGRVLLPPGEFDFESMFAGNASFKVEILPGLTQSDAKRWRYFCRLWPLEEGKLEISEIPFAYINPDIPWPNKQLMLDFNEQLANFFLDWLTKQQANVRVQLIHVAHGVHSQTVFRHSLVVAKTGGALIPRACCNLCQSITHGVFPCAVSAFKTAGTA